MWKRLAITSRPLLQQVTNATPAEVSMVKRFELQHRPCCGVQDFVVVQVPGSKQEDLWERRCSRYVNAQKLKYSDYFGLRLHRPAFYLILYFQETFSEYFVFVSSRYFFKVSCTSLLIMLHIALNTIVVHVS